MGIRTLVFVYQASMFTTHTQMRNSLWASVRTTNDLTAGISSIRLHKNNLFDAGRLPQPTRAYKASVRSSSFSHDGLPLSGRIVSGAALANELYVFGNRLYLARWSSGSLAAESNEARSNTRKARMLIGVCRDRFRNPIGRFAIRVFICERNETCSM